MPFLRKQSRVHLVLPSLSDQLAVFPDLTDLPTFSIRKGLPMIVDDIHNYAKYLNLSPGIARALEYLGSTDFTHVESGQYELDGKNLVSIVQRYTTRLRDKEIWESHRKYIDVQFMAGGGERFGHVKLDKAPSVQMPYSDEKDVIFYEPGTEYFDAPMGTFMIFYPEDIHAPCCAVGNPPKPAEVVKVVVKVAVNPA